MSALDKKLAALLKDYGYQLRGTSLYMLGIRGFMSEQKMGDHRSLFGAAWDMVPIIHDDEYFNRLSRICGN